jgi:hypothetical protein
MKERRSDARDAMALAELIKPLLRGVEHGVQGAVLAELLGGWLAAQYHLGPILIEEMLQHFMNTVRRLVGIEIAIMLQARGKDKPN